MGRRNNHRNGDFWGFYAFVVILVLGAALITSFTLSLISNVWLDPVTSSAARTLGSIAAITERIAIAAALVIPFIISYRYARVNRVRLILWIISVVIIVVLFILGFSLQQFIW